MTYDVPPLYLAGRKVYRGMGELTRGMHFCSPPLSDGNAYHPIYHRWMSLNFEIGIYQLYKS